MLRYYLWVGPGDTELIPGQRSPQVGKSRGLRICACLVQVSN